MAFRTNKVPAIEERTVSGSSVSFNSAFALPLKKCEVSFMATQSGSGKPSPQNVRPIVPVSSVDLSVNSVSVIVPLGDSYGGGNGDILTGNGIADYVYLKLSDLTWTYTSGVFRSNNKFSNSRDNAMCECYEPVSAGVGTIQDGQINFVSQYWDNNNRIIVKDTRYTDVESWLADVGDYKIVYSSTPIELTFTPTPINTILGNNTFSTDTGTLEITFSDLQEKSASGSVATFNTALAMPLVNGEFTIQAYQEGTGDPAPDNVRNIVGFNAINISHSDGVNTPVIYTKSLGETVYGGSYNSVSGDKKKTHKEIIYNGSENWLQNTQGYFYTSRPSDSKVGTITSLCNMLKNYASSSELLDKGFYIGNNNIVFRYDGISLNDFKTLISNTNLQVSYELAEPIESNIGATPIETYDGSNNIFCDTGDTSLVFNDLDLAKRGSFREVFKLPS